MKEQFTKGNWIAVGHWVEHEGALVADIASFDPAAIGQEHMGRADAEICANAELCAAAPEMFRLLKRLAAKCAKNAELAYMEDEIKAVISRARGDGRQLAGRL